VEASIVRSAQCSQGQILVSVQKRKKNKAHSHVLPRAGLCLDLPERTYFVLVSKTKARASSLTRPQYGLHHGQGVDPYLQPNQIQPNIYVEGNTS